MMGSFLALLAVGGLGSLVAMADPTRAQFFPFTLAMLFSGLGVWGLLLGFGSLEELIGPAQQILLRFWAFLSARWVGPCSVLLLARGATAD